MRLYAIIAGLMAAGVLTLAGGPSASAQTQTEKKESKVVEVQPGDYLAKIAGDHQTTYQRLYDANLEIKDPDLIYPGNKVRIPHPEEQIASRPLPEDTPAPVAKKSVPAPKAVKSAPKKAAPKVLGAASVGGSVWDRLAQCESGGNWSINTGNGYYGGLQFSLPTWRSVGGSGYPHQASREEQIARAEILLARSGWGQWPACSSKLGLR